MNPPANLLPLISSTIEKIKAKKKEMDAITSEMRLLLEKKAGEFFVLCVSESGCVYQRNGMIAHKRCF